MSLKMQIVKAAVVIAFLYVLYATIGVFFMLIALGFIGFIYAVLKIDKRAKSQKHRTGVYYKQ